MKTRTFLVFTFLVISNLSLAQGRKSNWQIGYNSGLSPFVTSEKAKISFLGGSTLIQAQTRKMNFKAVEGNISDKNGNLLMTSNGVWIANANGDTMLNGNGLNPGLMVNGSTGCSCLKMLNSNLFLPYPGDTTKYILFHTVANYYASLLATELFYTTIDMNLDGGLGGVISKNQIVFSDTLMWSIAAVKHGNGRDWWILMVKDSSDIIFKVLLTASGIYSVTSQSVGGDINYHTSLGQSVFSSDGKKFAYTAGWIDTTGGTYKFITNIRLFDFDRCSGSLSNYRNIPNSNYYSSIGLCFSGNSQYLYSATVHNIFQIDTDLTIPMLDTVAVNDGYFSPISPFQSDFYSMYLAEDNKIYITSGNGVVDLHYINHPDSASIACDVQQHAMHLPCFNSRTIPNHPNYELGADIGSVCDTLPLGLKIISKAFGQKTVNINPNPVVDFFYINYELQVHENGLFILYDTFGKEVLRRNLYGSMKTLLVNNLELPSGIYFYSTSVQNKLVSQGKIAVVK